MSPPAPPQPRTPGLARRLACLLYEGLLVFGLVMTGGFLYAAATRQPQSMTGTRGLQLWLFLLMGAYFTVCWSRLGQTLAMKTWHIRLVTHDLRPVGTGRALLRYLLSWLWFVPALVTLQVTGLKGAWPTTVMLAVGVLAYASLSRLHPQRAYLHDAICGTRLIDTRTPPPSSGGSQDSGQNPAP